MAMKTTRVYLQKYANQLRVKHYSNMPQVAIYISAKTESRTAGRAHGRYLITIQKWMLVDKEEAKATIRHELAHNIVNWLELPKVIAHGKEFHQILKKIAPRTWKQDLHWHYSEAITEARSKVGIKPHEYKPMKWRWFTCGNIDCHKHLYAWKRIPYYIEAGLFGRCSDCGCPDIVEIKTDKPPAMFTSVH